MKNLLNKITIMDDSKLVFVKYEYKNCLCRGKVTFSIGDAVITIDEPFWESGGCIVEASEWGERSFRTEGPWSFDWDKAPGYLRGYENQFEEMFNENVPWGCCGACL